MKQMNSTQKIWMNAHNKKKRYGSRSRRKNYRNNAVFGDSAVPSLHDVTLKMHKVIDHADNALLSFKPINYNRIHKRWRNKKYKIVSGGVNGAAAAETIVTPQSVTIIKAVAASGEAENGADATVVDSSADSKGGDECLESRESRTFSGRLVNNDTIRISEQGVGTYDAFIQELAALNKDAANEKVEGPASEVPPPSVEEAPAKPEPAPVVKENPVAKPTVAPAKNKPDLGANSIAAAAGVAGAAGAAAAAALFTDDNSPANITPTLSDFIISPKTVTIGGDVPTVTKKPSSASNGAITYSSNNDNVATIDATGLIALVGAGTVFFTAKQAAAKGYAAAEKKSNVLTVEKVEEKETQLDWPNLKTRWIQVNNTPTDAYRKELNEQADPNTENVTRKQIFDWLEIESRDIIDFDINTESNKTNSKNKSLFTALSDWVAKWNEYGGKIRTIVSIKGGGESGGTGTSSVAINKSEGYNNTKVTFNYEYKVDEADKKANGLENNEYGKFYAGFDAGDNNAERYKKGNFKDMISTLEKGGNAAIFGYGYSGSGKTYTLTHFVPGKHDDDGIAIKLLNELLLESKKFTIELTISELYCIDFTINSQHAVIFDKKKKELEPYPINEGGEDKNIKQIKEITDFTSAITTVETLRKAPDKMHIKYTLNNPESSRGHLFYKFLLKPVGSSDKKPATLTIVDMGGRENPVELSESSYMMIKGNNIGQIVDRISDNQATYYSKTGDGVYPSTPNKPVSIDNECSTVRHITGEYHEEPGWHKCPSLISASFGELFFTDYINAFNKYDFSRLPLTVPAPVFNESEQKIISEKIKLFLEACKEGIYINETINHLVAYINFLSNITKIKNIPDKIAKGDASGKGALISLDKKKGVKSTVYTYNPGRYIINPLAYIKYNDNSRKLRTLIDDKKIYNDIEPTSIDAVGILKELWQIKNPGEEVPAIICFIACVRNDNTLPKHRNSTKSTLEFAMSVSASNAPILDHAEQPEKPTFFGPEKPPEPIDLNAKIAEYVGTNPKNPKKIQTKFDPIVVRFKNDSKNAQKNNRSFFLQFLNTEIDKVISNEEGFIQNQIKEPILLRVLQYLVSRPQLLPQFKDKYGRPVSLNNITTGTASDIELLRKVKELDKSGGSGIRTRKRKSRREKKTRITRRRNRV
jgi:hypothetical protein